MPRRKRLKDKRTARLVLRKHSALVQMSNRVTAHERKVFNFLMHNARRQAFQDPERVEFQTTIREVRDKTGVDTTDTRKIKAMFRRLMEIVVEYNVLEKDRRWWQAHPLLWQARVSEHKDGLIYYRLPDPIRQVLVNPDMYATIALDTIRDLDSKYAVALYELARDYIGAEIPWMTMEQFKQLMGIPPERYKDTKDLRKWVLEPAVREINRKTDLVVSYAVDRHPVSHKWLRIKFHVRRKDEGIEPGEVVLAYRRALDHGLIPPPKPFTLPQIVYFMLAGDPPGYVAGLIRAATDPGVRSPVALVRSKLRTPPAERFEPLLYMDELLSEYDNAILDSLAARIVLAPDWRDGVRRTALQPQVVERVVESAVRTGTLHIRSGESGEIFYILPTPAGPGGMDGPNVFRFIAESLRPWILEVRAFPVAATDDS